MRGEKAGQVLNSITTSAYFTTTLLIVHSIFVIAMLVGGDFTSLKRRCENQVLHMKELVMSLGRCEGIAKFITRMTLTTDSAYILSSAYEKNIADLKAQLEMLRAQMAKSQSEIAKEEDAVRREGGRPREESSLGRRQFVC